MTDSAARTAFTIASEIKALMADLQSALDKVAAEEEYSAIQRHMIMSQVCDFFSGDMKGLEAYVDAYLEEKVDRCKQTAVPGFTIRSYNVNGGDGADSLYIVGMTYEWKAQRSVDILNKDTKSWGTLIKLMVDVGLHEAIQKRLTLSIIDDDRKLEKLHGLVAIKETWKWSIAAPRKTAPRNKG